SEIEISAYSSRSDLIRIPAALQVLKDSLHLDQSFSFAGLLNQAPGVKIEERSPGSYRLSIRGSTLRSPFGVRNIKVYLNGFSLSDGGGNTYLQLLNPSMISKAEVIKGPASSMYGSGAGGALLLSSSDRNEANISIGSYHRRQESLNLTYKVKNWDLRFFGGDQRSKGYRDQSALRRDMLFSSQKYVNNKSTFQLFQLYGDLDYETPGGLTIEQQTANPRQARPAAGKIPGAVEQHAGIRNKTLMGGIGYDYTLNQAWDVSIKGSLWYTDFQNPFITNYEVRNEMNYAFRPILKYFKSSDHGNLEWTNGYEYLSQSTLIKNFGNKKGTIDTLQVASNIAGNQSNLFTQLQWNIDRWQILSGISLNQQIFKFKGRSAINFTRKESGPILMPRLSVSYNLSSASSVFVSAARGNSPPTLAEIRPSSGEYNQELLPEQGWNYELGYRNYGSKLEYNLNLYSLKLQDAIVRRNDLAGVEYFINSGGAIIHGIETSIKYRVKALDLSFATAWQPYEFVNYKQRTTDFSGLSMTGVPEHTITTQLNWIIVPNLHLGLSYYYQSDLPLNDANTAKLPSYNLLSGYAQWDITHRIHFTLSGENLLNEQYSSGPDINAAANRYYNPGAQSSIIAGIRYNW
ncbi:MAG: TonB-dependent receptor, partial [Saprospiraceae bacterium]